MTVHRNPTTQWAFGFTLVEVLIAMAAGAVLLTAVVTTLVIEYRSYALQGQVTEMVQTARAAMDMICREARMAGYDPRGSRFEGIPYDPSSLRLLADIRGAKPHDPPDGDIDDPNEDIAYSYDSKNRRICRNTGGGRQPFAEHVEAFEFARLDHLGQPATAGSDTRQIRITIRVRTARADPTYALNAGYRTYELSSLVTPVNLLNR